jgi:hypothetical protein
MFGNILRYFSQFGHRIPLSLSLSSQNLCRQELGSFQKKRNFTESQLRPCSENLCGYRLEKPPQKDTDWDANGKDTMSLCWIHRRQPNAVGVGCRNVCPGHTVVTSVSRDGGDPPSPRGRKAKAALRESAVFNQDLAGGTGKLVTPELIPANV